MNGVAAHDGHKNYAQKHGAEQRAQDEFADRAAFGDAGNKAAHKGTPGDPPGPVKDRPAVEPAVAFTEGIRPEAGGDQMGHILTEGVHHKVQDEQHGTAEENKHQKDRHENHIGIAEDLDPSIDAADGRSNKQSRCYGDNPKEKRVIVRNAENIVQTAVDLHGAQPQRSGHTEDRGEYRQHIDDAAEEAVGAFFTDHRRNTAAHQSGFSFAELEIGQRQADNAVARPGMNAPMHERVAHGQCRGFGRTPVAVRRIQVVAHGFRNGPENKADAHACGKKHEEPAESRMFRPFIVFPQTDLSVFTESDINKKTDKENDRQQIKPAEIRAKSR